MADNFGLKIGVEGEKEFKNALRDINQSFKVLGSEMQLVSSEFDKQDKSVAAVAARNEVLNKAIDAQKEKISTLEAALKNAADSFGENDKRTQNWAIQLNNAKAELNGMERELTDNEKALDDMGKEEDDAAKSADNLGDELKEAGDDAEKSGGKFEKLGGVLKGIGAAMGAVALAAGAAAIKLGKEVVAAYADYEQLVGGVDTLFADASQTVQNYAAKAFKTAGMSANEYMETVTGFSASLIQSLGGDTAKAAEVADMAITDMADNANKMGSDMTSIQNAYQGFAKQNYTMLDNLKLGYGGTKSEMERLLADAEKFSGIKYDISSYSDVAEAIHVIQTQMGITGTTAKEATATISGSIQGMQSAIGNLMAGLGNADADIGMLMGNVVESFQTVVKNIAPIIENIANALPEAVGAMIGAIGELLPTLLDTVVGLFTQVLTTLLSLLPELIPAAVSAVMTIVQAIIDNLPLLIDAAVQLVTSLVQGIGQALPQIIEAIVAAIPQIIDGILSAVLGAIPQLIDAGIRLLVSLIQNLPQIITTLVAAIPKIITSLVSAIVGNIDKIVMAGVQLLVSLITNLPTIIVEVVKAVPQIIAALVKGFTGSIGQIVQVGGNLIKGLWQGISDAAGWLWDKISGFFGGIVDRIKNFFGIHSPSTLFAGLGSNMGEGIGVGFEKAMAQVSDDMQNAIPTDFDVNAGVNVNGSTGFGGFGNSPLVVVQQMIVRTEDDIRRISQELYNLMQTGTRAQGRFSPA